MPGAKDMLYAHVLLSTPARAGDAAHGSSMGTGSTSGTELTGWLKLEHEELHTACITGAH